MVSIEQSIVDEAKKEIYRTYSHRNYNLYAQSDPNGIDRLSEEAIRLVAPEYQHELDVANRIFPRTDSQKLRMLTFLAERHLANIIPTALQNLRDLCSVANGVRIVFFVGAGVSFKSWLDWNTIREQL